MLYCVCLGVSAGRAARWYWLTSPQIALGTATLYFLFFTMPLCLALCSDIGRGTNKKERAVHLRERGGEVAQKGSCCRNIALFLCGSRAKFQLV